MGLWYETHIPDAVLEDGLARSTTAESELLLCGGPKSSLPGGIVRCARAIARKQTGLKILNRCGLALVKSCNAGISLRG